ncbi:MAG: helix-turn-helix domain-containing protein [Lachnospiraceae bacterium]|nr:helix-turn-helix domain-containing protein [Lachnospiraceae bacterium]
MPKENLIHLGQCIRAARYECRLSQEQLANQTRVAQKTIQKIEKGNENPSYEILDLLIKRLGISANSIFYFDVSENDVDIQHLIGKLQACTPENRKILMNTLDFLAEQLIAAQSPRDSNE